MEFPDPAPLLPGLTKLWRQTMNLTILQDINKMVSENALAKEVVDATGAAFKRLGGDLLEMERLLNAPDATMTQRLAVLFGNTDEATRNQVRAVITRMLTVIKRPASLNMTWSKPRSSSVDNYAYVYTDVDPMTAGSMFIYFDERYKIAEEHGLNNRYLPLVHEFSHLAARTKDHKYDKDCFWALNKAMGNSRETNTPYRTTEAVENADCYGFLMAATFQRTGRPCPLP
jgi:hypothetical protein